MEAARMSIRDRELVGGHRLTHERRAWNRARSRQRLRGGADSLGPDVYGNIIGLLPTTEQNVFKRVDKFSSKDLLKDAKRWPAANQKEKDTYALSSVRQLDVALNQDWSWPEETEVDPYAACDLAAGIGCIDVMKRACGDGRKWGPSTCAAAAANGHLEMLKWLRTNNANLDT
jgi:hypothetical protein